MSDRIELLDHGYIRLIEHWGSDQRIIESARMSTQKGFIGWGPVCEHCGRSVAPALVHADLHAMKCYGTREQPGCGTVAGKPGDEKLLKFMWDNQHCSPFEFAGLVIEAKAPLMVFREWHRHRTWSYSEMSARYSPLPDENYVPSIDRTTEVSRTNRQAGAATGSLPLDEEAAHAWRQDLAAAYDNVQDVYARGLQIGIPKELARLIVPVGRYSVMRATANLRNVLAFIKLRSAPNAQAEIRVYSDALATMVQEIFPRTFEVARSSMGL